MRRFDIIGAGMGTRETLTGEAAQALASAEMVFATERLAEICENAQICLFSELAERAIACGADRAALLVSGDVGFFSAAGKLREKLLAHGEVRLFCGLSSMQYLCAKIGISYENACIRSLHGRKETCSARSATMRKRSRWQAVTTTRSSSAVRWQTPDSAACRYTSEKISDHPEKEF